MTPLAQWQHQLQGDAIASKKYNTTFHNAVERQYLKPEGRQYIICPDIPPSKYKKNSFEPTFRGLWRSGIWNMVSTQGSAPRIHGFPKGPSRRPGHQTRQLQDRRCYTSNRAIDNYHFYPFLKVKDNDILLIFIWKCVSIQGYLWQLVCTNKYRIVRYGFSMEHRSWSEEQIL